FGAGFMFFLALFMRPNLAPFAAVMLGGAGILALSQVQIRRLAGLSFGFLPVFSMALHNWVYGRELVLFTTSVAEQGNLPTPPWVYLAAFGEMLRFDFFGGNLSHALRQIGGWLSGPSESLLMVPLNVVAVVVLLHVLVSRRHYDFWIRLI